VGYTHLVKKEKPTRLLNMKSPSFSICPSKEILTANSGLILFGKFCQKIGLSKDVKECLPAPGSNRGYPADCFVLPLILMLHAGGQCLEGMRVIRSDPGLCRLTGLPKIPSPHAIGDWLRRIGEGPGLDGLAQVNKKIVHALHKSLEENDLTLDIDATGIEAEKYGAFYTYKNYKGYMPLVGHIAETGAIVGDEFREGNVAPATGNREFIQRCAQQLPKGKRIAYVRSDSAAYQAEIFNDCEANNISYAIGGRMCASLLQTIKRLPESAWQRFVDRHGIKTNTEIATVAWSMEDTKNAFTMIVKRAPIVQPDLFNGERYSYHLVATNRCEEDPQTVLHWYYERADHSENGIKELKIGFGMEQMPCGTLNANAVFFRLGVLAYNLFILFKRKALDSRWLRSKINTIRLHIYHLPGKIVRTARRLFLQVPMHAVPELQRLYHAIDTG
jgi:Transposase DDE domain group 1